jgi:nucleoside-diphosphate-sugar epimerase
MAIFMTGATGYIGSYATEWLLRNTDHELALLVRAPDYDAGVERLWKSLQLHMEADEFHRHLDRICFISGDLTKPGLGISAADYDWLISNRPGALVIEDEPLDWSQPDFNAYTRTKKFCEHMVRELLQDVPCLVVRPSSVIGDSRFAETTQFDMVRGLCALADLPVLPISPDARLDIVNADWVGAGLAELHVREDLAHDTYHLSAGAESRTIGEIADAFSSALGKRVPRFAGQLAAPFERVMDVLANFPKAGNLQRIGALLSVFIPYIATDIVYDNRHAVADLHSAPTPFTSYGAALYTYAKSVNFEFPYKPLPEGLDLSNVPPSPIRPMA